MGLPRIVLDTNVLVAALRSNRGASFRLLELVGSDRFDIVVSVPLIFEYEYALGRHLDEMGMTAQDVAEFLDYLCAVGSRHSIFYLWRPTLRDPKDDLVLEVAVAGQCEGIVTFNVRDFVGAGRFGLWIEPPREFLARIGVGR